MITLANDSFLQAARGRSVDRTPVWIMRQAGRVLPEYRAVRDRHSFLDLARIPELCAEVMGEHRLSADLSINVVRDLDLDAGATVPVRLPRERIRLFPVGVGR